MTAVEFPATLDRRSVRGGGAATLTERPGLFQARALSLRDHLAGDVPALRKAFAGVKAGAALVSLGVMVAAASLLVALLLLVVGTVFGVGAVSGAALLPLLLGVGLAGLSVWAGRAKAAAARVMAEQAGDPIRLAIAAHIRDMYGVDVSTHYLLPVFPLEERRVLGSGPDGDVRLAVRFEDLDSPVSVTVLGSL